MSKAEVIEILDKPKNAIDAVLYFVNPEDSPRSGHTTVVYKIYFSDDAVTKFEEVPAVDMTGNKPRPLN